MSQNYSYPTSSSVTLTGTANNAPIPSTSLLVAGENNSGNQTVFQMDAGGNLKVVVESGATTPQNVNIMEVGGSAIAIGQATMASSLPVVIASNQSAVTVAQATPGNLLAQVSQPTASALNATVVQATAANLNATVVGTVTANAGTNLNTSALALDTSVTGLQVSQGSTTSGEKGTLIQGAVTTAAPTYVTAQTSPLSLTTAGALRVDASSSIQPVSGTVTANQGSANATPWNQNISQYGGSATTLGSKVSASSMPVVIASDQGAVTVAQATAANLNATVVQSTASNLKAQVSAGTGTLTDGSGTTSGTPSTSTQIFAANASRKYLLIQNLDTTNSIYINFTSAASNGTGSYTLAPLGTIVQESTYVSTEVVNVLATVASVKFTAKQG